MATAGPASPGLLRSLPCPRCGEWALEAPLDASPPAAVSCRACGARQEAIADVVVVEDRVRRVGGCCAGFLRHELRWRDGEGNEGGLRFETWVQDHVLLRSGDRASLLFPPGDLMRRKGLPMPLSAANHTLGTIWALPGSSAPAPPH